VREDIWWWAVEYRMAMGEGERRDSERAKWTETKEREGRETD
jgi:hypothetical protein